VLDIADFTILSILISIVVTTIGQHITQTSTFINIRNYGCILQPIRTFIPVSDSWLHTYAINLSSITDLTVRPPDNCSTLTNPEQVATCNRIYPIIQTIQEVDRQALYELRRTMAHVMDILHDTLPTKDSRRRLGLFDLLVVLVKVCSVPLLTVTLNAIAK
jgi:hypothetical protein